MTLILLGLLFAVADRMYGAEKPAFKGKKAAIVLGLLAGGYLLGGAMGAALGGIFFAARCIPPRQFGGDFTPTGKERVGAFLRYAVVIPAGIVAALMTGSDPIKAGIAMTVWAGVATALSSYYGEQEAKAIERGEALDPSMNTWIETSRGFAFGVLAGLL